MEKEHVNNVINLLSTKAGQDAFADNNKLAGLPEMLRAMADQIEKDRQDPSREVNFTKGVLVLLDTSDNTFTVDWRAANIKMSEIVVASEILKIEALEILGYI